MANLLDALLNSKPRERSGSGTAGRYDFQAHVSIMKIIELHESGEDYRAIFDYFDDLMILNSETTPNRIRFYQIKSKGSGRWTIHSLTHGDSKTPPPTSILGRMYFNVSQFHEAIERLGFVSNAGFNFKLKDGSKTGEGHVCVEGADLHLDERKKIDAAIDAEFGSPSKYDCNDILVFEQTSFGPRDQSIYAIGRLVDYFDKKGDAEDVPIKAIYKTIFTTISSKTAFNDDTQDHKVLFDRKSLCRSEVELLLSRGLGKRRFQNCWPHAERELFKQGANSFQIIKLKNSCIQYISDRAAGLYDATRLSALIQETIRDQCSEIEGHGWILEVVALLHSAIPGPDCLGYSNDYLYGALIVESYEAMNG